MSEAVNVEHYLEGLEYPVRHDDLVEYAQTHNAPDHVMKVLRELPGETFESAADLDLAIS